MSDDFEFELTEEHIKLLRRMRAEWGYGEAGAPAINPKRPYGNGDHIGDIADILGIEERYDPKTGEFRDDLYERLQKLHKETEHALAILLRFGTVEPGRYRSTRYGLEWERAS